MLCKELANYSPIQKGKKYYHYSYLTAKGTEKNLI